MQYISRTNIFYLQRTQGNGPPSPGSATPRLAKSVLVDVDMASSGRRSSPGSPNSTLGEEDPFPGPWKPLLYHFSAHHAVLFQFVRNCCRCIQLCCRPIWFLFGLISIIFDAIIFLFIKFQLCTFKYKSSRFFFNRFRLQAVSGPGAERTNVQRSSAWIIRKPIILSYVTRPRSLSIT